MSSLPFASFKTLLGRGLGGWKGGGGRGVLLSRPYCSFLSPGSGFCDDNFTRVRQGTPANRTVTHHAPCQVAIMKTDRLHQAGQAAAGVGPSSCPENGLDTSATWAPGSDTDYIYLVELMVSHPLWTCIELDQLAVMSWRQCCQGDHMQNRCLGCLGCNSAWRSRCSSCTPVSLLGR